MHIRFKEEVGKYCKIEGYKVTLTVVVYTPFILHGKTEEIVFYVEDVDTEIQAIKAACRKHVETCIDLGYYPDIIKIKTEKMWFNKSGNRLVHQKEKT